MSTENFGMMNGAYFVSRLKIINWINELLELKIKKVEDCATGAIYCQIVHSIFGSKAVPIRRIDYTVKYKHQFIRNYKILQEAFRKIGLKKSVPVEKLMKEKYQDNLEFLQWIYQWYQRNTGTSEAIKYDGQEQRNLCKGGKNYIYNLTKNDSKNDSKEDTKNDSKEDTNRNNPKALKPTFKPIAARTNPPKRLALQSNSSSKLKKSIETELKTAIDENSKLKEEIKELTDVAQAIEKERDYYFKKVLKIESICNGNAFGADLSKQILDTLYEKKEQMEKEKQEEGEVEMNIKQFDVRADEKRLSLKGEICLVEKKENVLGNGNFKEKTDNEIDANAKKEVNEEEKFKIREMKSIQIDTKWQDSVQDENGNRDE